MIGDEETEWTQILASITAWEGQVLAAKRRLNELTPAGKLPSEVLSKVFMHQSAGWYTGAKSWIGVSRVCHRWRETALNYSALWGQITTHTSEWTRGLLLRSKQASLDVRIPLHCFSDVEEEDIVLLLRELGRVRSFDWDFHYPLKDLDISKVGPLLHSVSLRGYRIPEYVPFATPFDAIEARH